MTLQQFFDKWIGKGLDADGVYGNQCVDLIKQYFVEVIGIPAIRNNAVDYWINYPIGRFTKIVNTPSFIPKAGDIIVWNTSVGPYGHIAICTTEATVNYFVSVDQNWPVGSIVHAQKHSYSGVLGVLRPNKDVMFDQAAYDAAIVAENAKKAAAEAAKKVEADRLAAEAAAEAKAEADRVAKEQAVLEAELKAKQEVEAQKVRDNLNFFERFRVALADLLAIISGWLWPKS
jgi:hypothetical protein